MWYLMRSIVITNNIFDNNYVGAFCEFVNKNFFQAHESFRTAHFFATFVMVYSLEIQK